MTHKYTWTPVEEMDLDDGTHTCYSSKTAQGKLVTLTQLWNDTWDVEKWYKTADGSMHFSTLCNCKTLTSAKRWVARYY